VTLNKDWLPAMEPAVVVVVPTSVIYGTSGLGGGSGLT